MVSMSPMWQPRQCGETDTCTTSHATRYPWLTTLTDDESRRVEDAHDPSDGELGRGEGLLELEEQLVEDGVGELEHHRRAHAAKEQWQGLNNQPASRSGLPGVGRTRKTRKTHSVVLCAAVRCGMCPHRAGGLRRQHLCAHSCCCQVHAKPQLSPWIFVLRAYFQH